MLVNLAVDNRSRLSGMDLGRIAGDASFLHAVRAGKLRATAKPLTRGRCSQ